MYFRLCLRKIVKSSLIYKAVIITSILNINCVNSGTMPSALYENDTTTCDDFSRFARFNPYTLLNEEWMMFYYWGPPQSPMFAIFFVPTTKQKNYLKYILDGHVLEPVNWTARMLVMRERDNSTYLLVEQSDRGHYLLYEPLKGLEEGDIVEAVDIRIKQTGDIKYFGIMDCKQETVYMYAKLKDVPKKSNLKDEATRLGYRGRGGKSYLYQGHQWMPIPEADDQDFDEAMKNTNFYIRKD